VAEPPRAPGLIRRARRGCCRRPVELSERPDAVMLLERDESGRHAPHRRPDPAIDAWVHADAIRRLRDRDRRDPRNQA